MRTEYYLQNAESKKYDNGLILTKELGNDHHEDVTLNEELIPFEYYSQKGYIHPPIPSLQR